MANVKHQQDSGGDRGKSRDFRMWDLTKADQGLVRRAVNLNVGDFFSAKIEGSADGARTIEAIVNSYFRDVCKKQKLLITQDSNSESPSLIFTIVAA